MPHSILLIEVRIKNVKIKSPFKRVAYSWNDKTDNELTFHGLGQM